MSEWSDEQIRGVGRLAVQIVNETMHKTILLEKTRVVLSAAALEGAKEALRTFPTAKPDKTLAEHARAVITSAVNAELAKLAVRTHNPTRRQPGAPYNPKRAR